MRELQVFNHRNSTTHPPTYPRLLVHLNYLVWAYFLFYFLYRPSSFTLNPFTLNLHPKSSNLQCLVDIEVRVWHWEALLVLLYILMSADFIFIPSDFPFLLNWFITWELTDIYKGCCWIIYLVLMLCNWVDYSTSTALVSLHLGELPQLQQSICTRGDEK